MNDRLRFKGFFRTLPSFGFIAPALAKVARQFDWTQMAIITQRVSVFTEVGLCMQSNVIHVKSVDQE